MRAAVIRVARGNPTFIAARIGEVVGCSGQVAAYHAKCAGIVLPKAFPGNGKGRKTGPKPDAVGRAELTAEMVRAALSYDAHSGAFIWRKSRPKVVAGSPAGTIQRGYWMVHLRGEDYHAHRLAWLYVYGRWPAGDLDHINRDKLDNRIANLREASRSENCANIGVPSHNTSGFKGVSYNRMMGKWTAYIRCRGRRYHLGAFATAEAAAAAYDEAAVRLFGRFARTNMMIQSEVA